MFRKLKYRGLPPLILALLLLAGIVLPNLTARAGAEAPDAPQAVQKQPEEPALQPTVRQVDAEVTWILDAVVHAPPAIPEDPLPVDVKPVQPPQLTEKKLAAIAAAEERRLAEEKAAEERRLAELREAEERAAAQRASQERAAQQAQTAAAAAPAADGLPDDLVLLDTFYATAYYLTGLTATGTYTTENRTLAVNPDIIPYGTHVWIFLDDGTFVGDYYAEDTGGNMMKHPYVVDIYMGNDYEKCVQWGSRHVSIYVRSEN